MRYYSACLLVLFIFQASLYQVALGKAQKLKSQEYESGDKIPLYVNRIGPYNNPSETYDFYSLPFCKPEKTVTYKSLDFGEKLVGDKWASSVYDIPFKKDVTSNTKLCDKLLRADEIEKFRKAIKQEYYFMMFYDNLPLWGYVGNYSEADAKSKSQEATKKYYLYTNYELTLHHNNKNVLGVNLSTTPDHKVDLTDKNELQVTFTYSASWSYVEKPFTERHDRFRSSSVPYKQVQSFAVINSCVTVILLTGFLATILMRVLKNDFSKYMKDDELGEDVEESGWKLLHGDVFRFPPHINLFTSMLGTGTQLLVIVCSIFMLGLVGIYHPFNRGHLIESCVVLYAFTASVAGYTSGRYYKMFSGQNWVRNVLLSSVLYTGPFVGMFIILNTIAKFYGSLSAIPITTIIFIVFLWVLITFPLTVLGGIVAKNSNNTYNPPCRVNKYPRPIPHLPWYKQTGFQMLMAGFLPFSAIYIEVYYIFMTVWGHLWLTVFTILAIAFVILLIVTSFVTISLTYFQLASEDYRWWWRSFLIGGSTSIYLYVYCFYFYLAKSDFTGTLQTSFFFGYMLMICYGFFLMLGTVGFFSSSIFVRYIYSAIKIE